MNKQELISYTTNFVSFLLGSKVGKYVNLVVLFGSVVRGEFDKESDVDLFIDAEQAKKQDIEKQLGLYYKSEECEKYRLRGIKNDISLKIGRLDKWKSIKRSIIANGIILFGKYKEIPAGVKQYSLFTISLEKMPRKDKVSLWRKLYGYKQKIGEKIYAFLGLLQKNNGKKLGLGSFIVPVENCQNIINFFKRKKIVYTINDIWSDTI